VARQLGEAVAAWSIAAHASVVLGAEAPAGHAGSAVGLGGPLTAAEAGR